MPEGLFDQRQIHVPGHQVRLQAMLQAMRITLLGWQACSLGNRLEDAEELRAIDPTTLLRCEEIPTQSTAYYLASIV